MYKIGRGVDSNWTLQASISSFQFAKYVTRHFWGNSQFHGHLTIGLICQACTAIQSNLNKPFNYDIESNCFNNTITVNSYFLAHEDKIKHCLIRLCLCNYTKLQFCTICYIVWDCNVAMTLVHLFDWRFSEMALESLTAEKWKNCSSFSDRFS